MKNINFKRSNSAIRVWDEDQNTKKNINWDRLLYLVILAMFLFFGGRYLVSKFLYVNATGHILFEKRNIRNINDCQIVKFMVNEGDSVKTGDTLFSFVDDDENLGGGFGGIGSNGISITATQGGKSNKEWIEREIYMLRKAIAGNNVRMTENAKISALYTSQLKRTRQMVMLDLTPRSKLDELERSIEELNYENKRLQEENSQSAIFLNKLMNMDPTISGGSTLTASGGGGGNGGGGGEQDFKKYYFSPIDGTVTKINFQDMEVALKSEIILSVHKPENIYVKVFFDQRDLGDVNIGDIITIIFPDGTKSQGRITRFYFATNALPEEFQKKYEPTTRTLLADVYPVNTDELKKWKAFYRMGVNITKFRY
jgi:hypothetical protein